MPVWTPRNDDEATAIGRLTSESDRAAAIIAATILESKLEGKIKSRLRADMEHEGKETRTALVMRDMFKTDAPLGSFSARIKIGFLMKIYGERAYTELICIKDIRNLFAHQLSVQDFKTQQIAGKVRNLTIVDKYIDDSMSRNAIVENMTGNTIVLLGISINEAAKWFAEPKDRYIASCALYASWLMGNFWGRTVHEAIAGDGDAPPYPDTPW